MVNYTVLNAREAIYYTKRKITIHKDVKWRVFIAENCFKIKDAFGK